MNHPSGNASRGRLQLQFILALLFVMILGPVLAAWVRGETQRAAPQLLTLVLTGALFARTLARAWWARQLTVALTFLAGLLAVALGLFASVVSGWGLLLMLVGLVFLGCGVALVSSADVDAYVRGRA